VPCAALLRFEDWSAWHAQVTVLSIAALKKVGKGTRILLMDRYGGLSKAIARDLNRKGFKKACLPLNVDACLHPLSPAVQLMMEGI
jgi:hypothetical protein